MSSLQTVPVSSYSCPDLSSPPPPTFCKKTPNHLHFYIPDVQTILIFHASPHQQCRRLVNPRCIFYLSRTSYTSISTSYALSFPNFSDRRPSLPRFQFPYIKTVKPQVTLIYTCSSFIIASTRLTSVNLSKFSRSRIIISYFGDVTFFQAKLGSDVCPRVDNQTSGDTLQKLTRPLVEKSPSASYPPMGIGTSFWWRDALPPKQISSE